MLRAEDLRRHAEMLGNRTKKNHRALARKMESKAIGAYRLYDRDIPEVRAVVDWYEGHLVVGEYGREQTAVVPGYLEALCAGVAAAMGVGRERVHCPEAPVKGAKEEARGVVLEAREYGLKYEVTPDDYLDTGLAADQRELRQMVRREAAGKRFLSLYGYTGTFTVAAAAGGATSSDTVDLSGKCLSRAKTNLALNGVDRPEHWTVRAEVRGFLAEAKTKRRTWELAVIDAPSYAAGSGATAGSGLDVVRDHRALLEETLAVMTAGAVVYFVTGHPKFAENLGGLRARGCEEITGRTVPEDYRNKTVHRCWRVGSDRAPW